MAGAISTEFVGEEFDAAVFLKLCTPRTDLGITVKFIEVPKPERTVRQEEDEHAEPQLPGSGVLELRHGVLLTLANMPSPPGDHQDAEIAALDPLLGKLLGFVRGRRPVLHGVNIDARIA